MAEFKAFDENVKVNGQTILSVVKAMQVGQEERKKILENHGIVDPQPNQWYDQQNWLDAFKEIAHRIGEKTLYIIGRAIPENADFPPEIDNLEKALKGIDMAYHMNHKGGDIGHYTLESYDEKEKIAVMVCKNPYPSEFDRGIIMSMVSRFRPSNSIKYDVLKDLTKETRSKGGDSCTYKINW